MVARSRREPGLPPKCIKQVKTACMPRKFQDNLERPSTTCAQTVSPNSTKRRRSRCKASTRRPACRRSRQQGPPAGRTWSTLWRTAWPADRSCSPGLPGTDKTYLARTIVTKLRKRVKAAHPMQDSQRRQNLRRPTGCAVHVGEGDIHTFQILNVWWTSCGSCPTTTLPGPSNGTCAIRT